MSKGFGYAVNYTYSHGLANFQDNLTGGSTPANAYNYGAEMSNSPFDIAIVLSATSPGICRSAEGSDGSRKTI
jgi:hypothetical protein